MTTNGKNENKFAKRTVEKPKGTDKLPEKPNPDINPPKYTLIAGSPIAKTLFEVTNQIIKANKKTRS